MHIHPSASGRQPELYYAGSRTHGAKKEEGIIMDYPLQADAPGKNAGGTA